MITRTNVKINLGLNVIRKRPDGYHDLETLFVPFHGIHDSLEIIEGDDWSRTSAELVAKYGSLAQAVTPDGKVMISIAKEGGVGWNPLEDLCVKAYGLLAKDYDLPPVKIFLEKTSPVGAGLGGGSADCAFTLRMLSEIAGLGLTDECLASYAAALGSDCAFFIYNRPMWGKGRGEILSDEAVPFSLEGGSIVTPEGRFRIELTIPEGTSVSTADAYRGIVPREWDMPLAEVLSLPVSRWKDLLFNDFESTVFAKYPLLGEIKGQLYGNGAVYASMSGSGSAFFSLVP